MSLDPTPSQTAGPFFSFGLCVRPQNELVEASTPDAVRISGAVLDGAGAGVADALVEIWQADRDGAHRDGFGWGRCGTDAAGRYSFLTVKPGAVPHPDGPLQAPHLSLLVFARGLLKPVLTRMYFPDEQEANAADPVLSAVGEDARATLVAESDGGALGFDIRLQGDRQTTFFAL
jgi:protocatechuate 3,4-dioxygenase alpha subunit